MKNTSSIHSRVTTQPLSGLTVPHGETESEGFIGHAIFKDNPFDGFAGGYKVVEFIEGSTAEKIVDFACAENLWLKNYIEVKIGDTLIPRDKWHLVKLKKNAPITLMVVPQGGNAGNVLKMIAIVVVAAVVSYYTLGAGNAAFAGMFGGAGSVGAMVAGTLAVTAATMATSLALNAVFPPPTANQPQLGTESSQTSTAFGWNVDSNQFLKYQPVPRIYGRVKFAPPYAAKPFVETIGDQQYLYLLFDFGYGELKLEDLQIGENSIDSFANIQYYIHSNFKAGDKLNLYNRDVWQDSYSQKLIKSSWRIATTQPKSIEAVIDFNFNQGLAVVDKQTGNLLSNSVDLAVQFRKVGDANWRNYNEIQHNIIGGGTTVAGGQVDFYWNATSNEYEGNPNHTVYSKLPDPASIPEGGSVTLQRVYDSYNGSEHIKVSKYQDYLRSNSTISTTNIRVQNATQKAFTISVILNFPEEGEYEVRASRLSDDSSDRYIADDVYLTSMRSTKNLSPIAPEAPHTIVEMRILANDQLSGGVNNFTAVATSILPVWNGEAFTYQETRNPAWIYLDVLRGSAAVRPAPNHRLDLDSFKEWAIWCDSPALNAPESPKAQCDLVVSGNYTSWQVLKMVSSTGDATPSMRAGKYSISIDREKPYPIQMFTPRNSNSFTSSRAYHIQPHALRVQFIDPEQQWQQREIVVYDDGYSVDNATIFETLDLVGITNYSHAYRLGRRALAQGRLRQETFSIKVGLESIIATRGDLVRLSYDVPKIGKGWARIKDISGEVITIDEYTVNINPADYLRVRINDGTQVDLFVLEVTGDYTMRASGDMSNINVGQLVVWGELSRMTMDCIIKSINPSFDLTATIDLTPYAPAIYRAEVDEIPAYDPLITEVSSYRPNAVVNLQVNEIDTVINRYHYISIGLSWAKPEGSSPKQYIIYELQNKNWEEIGRTSELYFYAYKDVKAIKDNGQKTDLIGKNLTFAVVAVGAGGLRLSPSNAAQVTIKPLGDEVKPLKPNKFDLDIRTSTNIYIDWRHPESNDIDYYVIRYAPVFDIKDIKNSTIIADKVAYPTNSVTVPARLGTYFIKSVDTSGLVSDEAAYAVTPTEVLNNEFEITDIEDVNWSGRKGNLLVVDNDLVLMPSITPNAGERVGYYYFDKYINFGKVYSAVLSSYINAEPVSNQTIDSIEQYYDAYIEVRTADREIPIAEWKTVADVEPSIASGSVNMGAWRRLYSGEYTGIFFQYRLVVVSKHDGVGVRIKSAKAKVTAHIRTEGDYDVEAGLDGIRINFDPPFQQTVSIQITPSDVSIGDTYEIRNKSESGFDIRFFNSGTPIEKQFDWLVRGYGREGNFIPS